MRTQTGRPTKQSPPLQACTGLAGHGEAARRQGFRAKYGTLCASSGITELLNSSIDFHTDIPI
ncbi:hypothetical protein [Burkholderia sp. BCC0322]|uniref:hypothetical protein n=1 Tax=unclassified Burkholderia TaxID=2613784 RepID=UPI00158DF1D2|nr:hypothetical protein [Burkholderia sp. BCC0322]